MNLFWGLLVVVGASVLTTCAMLLVRRRAPDGSYFSDGDRASGVFGVLATGFSVLLGFIIFLAFTSYDESRSGAESEATIVTQQVETAQYLPPDTAASLTGELVCYARSVAGTATRPQRGRDQWPDFRESEITRARFCLDQREHCHCASQRSF